MGSVRLRLLLLALMPLIVLMPLLLVLAMTRWTKDYDDVLIANVESDLRIAEQYLGQILAGTGNNIRGIAGSTAFQEVLLESQETFETFLDHRKNQLQLDFLYYLPASDAQRPGERWPVISGAAAGELSTAIDIFSASELADLSQYLQAQANIPLIPTEAAVPTNRSVEDRGMVVHTASHVAVPGREGVLVGGVLLNRNLDFIDTINALVYFNAESGQNRQGTATLFLEDVRVSTNVRLFEDVRALGTRVSAAVRGAVLDEGKTWLDRAFVVNDWYISGYLPIVDSFGNRVGMLYVGFLEEPFQAAKSSAYWTVLAAFTAVVFLTAPVFLRLAKGIFSPLERVIQTMGHVEKGDLSARIGDVGTKDEIGQVAMHLDKLLNQVQERDQALRDHAGELNEHVERRTAQLKEANQKLEETFKQLVMSEKLASIGEIAAGVTHEINNPVAVIQGNVDVVRQTLGSKSEEVETELNLIDRQIVRIDAIVGKLLQFARPAEFGTFEESVEVAPLVEDSLILVKHQFSSQDIALKTSYSDVPMVRINPGELQQVIINLVMNAAQAMAGSGTLSISVSEDSRNGAHGTCLRVSDTGPGIPEEHLQSVFDPFYTTKQGEGTGLGLSISQTLIQRADGLISVRNKSGGGAEFAVWLPSAG